MKEKEFEDYVAFFGEFGDVLKEGAGQDFSNKDKLADLLLFQSTETEPGKYTTLREYVDRCRDGQEVIHYLIGETRRQIENSPYVEGLKARGEEVLLLTDPIDEFLVSSLGEYSGKQLKAVDRGEAGVEDDDELRDLRDEFLALTDALGTKIAEVSQVRLTSRLKDSASCLVADEGAMGAHMERLMKRMGRGEELPPRQRILELNGKHPVVQAVRRLYEENPEDPRVEEYGRLLYDQAVIAEGSPVQDPAAMAKRINHLIEVAASSGSATGGSEPGDKEAP